MTWNHNALALDLAEHLSASTDRMIWTDMQLGPSGSPRPDVYAINKSYSRFCPVAYECKVSVADFRSDITKGKWQSYLKYSCGVIFAVPKGLIDKADVPKGCGLIIRGENGWHSVKGATLTPAPELPRDAWMKLLIDGTSRSLRQHTVSQINQKRVHEVVAKKYGQELSQLLAGRDLAIQRLQEKTAFVQSMVKDVDMVYAMHHAKQEFEQMKSLKSELCQLIGEPEDTAAWTVIYRVRELLVSLDKDTSIGHLRQAITSSVRTIDSQLKKLREALDPVSSNEAPCKPLQRAGESD